jgi:Glycosyltransferase family 87
MDGFYLLLLGGALFLSLGLIIERAAAVTTIDFKVVYYSARSLLRGCDPYQESSLMQVYRAEGGDNPSDTAKTRRIEGNYMYLPTAFAFTVPFAMLPFGPAHALWLTLTAASLLLAAFLMWNIGADHAPVVSGGLVFLVLANSEDLLLLGNPAGIAVSLCVVAVWCFLREKFVMAGVICLAISLILKPHDAGLVWLYFLLAGAVHRKRALHTLAVSVVLSIPAILWTTHVSPHWMQELQFNLSSLSAHGNLNDPSLATSGARGLGMMVNLQTVMSLFWDDPRIYNPASYLVGGTLVLAWAIITLKSRPRRMANPRLALAAIAAISMLPIYHRQQDLILLLLTVPACAMLWSEGSRTGRLALLVTTTGFLLVGDLFWIIFDHLLPALAGRGFPGWAITAILVLMVPLILLLTGVFYLWIYARRALVPTSPAPSGGRNHVPSRPAPSQESSAHVDVLRQELVGLFPLA